MSNTLTDSQKLSMLANWLGAHSLLSDGKERKFCSDMAADLRRIASNLEKREAPSDEEKDREPLSKDERLKLARYFTERYTVDEMADFTTLLIRDMNNSDKEHITYWVNQYMKVSDQLTSALASRDYYKELAEAADKVIMHFKIGQPDTTYYSLESNLLIKQYQQLKHSK